ncbi:MAG: hypothetical protein RIB45_18005 [Marivibrio sp.]|uniref:hypothetical protein n=1 Tax=Marivibrio sp. TaxID=2039719 RepID=UPI0032ED2241
MPPKLSEISREAAAAPLGDIIRSVGEGVAAAQAALDEASLRQTLDLYAQGGDETVEAMRAIGYQPTFYVLPETTGEVTMALSLSQEPEPRTLAPDPRTNPAANPILRRAFAGPTRLTRPRLYGAPVDAGYRNRYGFDAETQAKITFTIKPAPPPGGAADLRRTPNFVQAGSGGPATVAQAQAAADLLGLTIAFRTAEGAPIESPDAAAAVTAQEPVADSLIDREATTIQLTL